MSLKSKKELLGLLALSLTAMSCGVLGGILGGTPDLSGCWVNSFGTEYSLTNKGNNIYEAPQGYCRIEVKSSNEIYIQPYGINGAKFKGKIVNGDIIEIADCTSAECVGLTRCKK